MKTLILVRHAKSDKSNPALPDMDRPLSPQGELDLLSALEQFAASGLRTDALVSSPALRARSVAEAFARQLSLPVQTDERIYGNTAQKLLETVRSFDDRCSAVMLVGHNPGLSEFLRYLTEENYADLPTASVAVVELPVKAWRYTFCGKGVLKRFFSPQKTELGMQHEGQVRPWKERFRFWRFEHPTRLPVILALTFGILLLLILIALIMHLGVDPAGIPQQGSR